MVQFYSEELGLERTDPDLWRLRTDELGRETWVYLTPEQAKNDEQCTFTQWLLQSEKFPKPSPNRHSGTTDFKAADACENGASFFKLLQDPDLVFSPASTRDPCF